MSEDNQQNKLAEINETIKSTIVNSKEEVKKRVVDSFVKEEIEKRVEKLSTLIKAINDFRKSSIVKPDIVSYGEDGAVLRKEFSKKKIDERNKNRDLLSKANKVFEKALMEGDYSGVNEIINTLTPKPMKTNAEEGKKS